MWPGNFLIDKLEAGGTVTLIDFGYTSILPSSFAKYPLADYAKVRENIDAMVYIPQTPGVDNTEALFAVGQGMDFRVAAFVRTGDRVPGNNITDKETQERWGPEDVGLSWGKRPRNLKRQSVQK